MELTDILPVEEWAELEREIYEKFGMRPRVYDVNGMGITDYSVYGNSLCRRIQATPKAQTFICAVAQNNMAAMSGKSREPVVEECDAGLMKVVVPIFVGDEFLGTAGACGKLAADGEVDTFMITRSGDIPEQEVEELARDVPVAARHEMEELASYVKKRLAEMMRTE
jgi:ligand-binding sensor protein